MDNKISKSNELDISKNKDNEIIIKLYKKYLNRYPDDMVQNFTVQN